MARVTFVGTPGRPSRTSGGALVNRFAVTAGADFPVNGGSLGNQLEEHATKAVCCSERLARVRQAPAGTLYRLWPRHSLR